MLKVGWLWWEIHSFLELWSSFESNDAGRFWNSDISSDFHGAISMNALYPKIGLTITPAIQTRHEEAALGHARWVCCLPPAFVSPAWFKNPAKSDPAGQLLKLHDERAITSAIEKLSASIPMSYRKQILRFMKRRKNKLYMKRRIAGLQLDCILVYYKMCTRLFNVRLGRSLENHISHHLREQIKFASVWCLFQSPFPQPILLTKQSDWLLPNPHDNNDC